jgi:hypothetical protein
VDPPTPVVQQLADEFEGVVEQGVVEFSNLASTIGAQSEEELIAAEELEEFNECKEDPMVAHIPDPSDEEMRAFGMQVTGEDVADDTAPDLEQVDDSSVESEAADPNMPAAVPRGRSKSDPVHQQLAIIPLVCFRPLSS